MLQTVPYYRNSHDAAENQGRAFPVSAKRVPFAVDIRDAGDSYVMEADFPGFQKENISVEIDGDTMTIRAERHSEREKAECASSYICTQRPFGVWERVFDISAVDSGAVAASYENGVLTLRLPKKASTAPQARRIEIQ